MWFIVVRPTIAVALWEAAASLRLPEPYRSANVECNFIVVTFRFDGPQVRMYRAA